MTKAAAPETTAAPSLPSAGERIEVLSDSFGRENGAWYPATVTGTVAQGGLIEAAVALPDGTTHAATVIGASGHWRRPA